MAFPHDDSYWQSVLEFLLARFGSDATIVAPREFIEFIPRTFPYDVMSHIGLETMDAIVIHKGRLDEVGQGACAGLAKNGIPLFGNEVFVIFSLKGRRPWRVKGKEHFAAFHHKVDLPEIFTRKTAHLHSEFKAPTTVILMTTYNRPQRLAASLRTIESLKAPVLVVDDGSAPLHEAAYAAVYDMFDVRVLRIPGNRGLSSALNAGLSYWLADPNVEWISYLQDDVEVRSDLLVVMAKAQDAEKFPLLTGRYDPLHKVYGDTEVNGQKVLLQRMSAGIHMHGHRAFWEKQIPIPTAYFQAPKLWPDMSLRGADEDWWITQWGPHSVVKQGKYVGVLPGLVRTTTALSAESTWGNPGLPDPPLAAPQFSSDDVVPAMHRPAFRSSKVAAQEPARNFWEALASRFGQTTELDIHIHAQEERGHLFHAIDSRTTELEVLNFINALVCLFKPEVALETGSFLGFGSCAIAAGLKSNGRGQLFSLEIDGTFLAWAREHLRQFDPSLEQFVTFIKESSLDFINRYQGAPFDFVFIDTELDIRMSEISLLRKRKLLAPGAICVVHDTSPHRLPETGGGGADDFFNRHILSDLGDQFESFQFPYSRGFHLFRHRGNPTERAYRPRSLVELFSSIYREKHWGGEDQDFYSGSGSHTSELFEPYIAAVRGYLSSFPAPMPVVVDLGCGDFAAGSRLVDLVRHYHGCDIVPELIARNRRLPTPPNVSFHLLDAITDAPPHGDVVIVKQVFQHLSNDQIAAIVRRLALYPVWIVTEHLPAGEFAPNRDKPASGYTRLPLNSGIDLTKEPFNIKPKFTEVLSEVLDDGNPIRTVAYRF